MIRFVAASATEVAEVSVSSEAAVVLEDRVEVVRASTIVLLPRDTVVLVLPEGSV